MFLFIAFALVYIAVNTTAVAGAAAFSTDRPFREVWYLNSRGLIAYDLGASIIAILVATIYARAQAAGYGPLGLVAALSSRSS